MKKLPRILTRFFLFLFPLLLLSGCGNTGKLNEGECKGVVAFTDIPKTFFMLDEELQKQFEIRVTLENITTEKTQNILKRYVNNELTLVGANGTVNVYSVDGVKVATTYAAGQETIINVSSLPSGIYIVKCGNQSFKFNKK